MARFRAVVAVGAPLSLLAAPAVAEPPCEPAAPALTVPVRLEANSGVQLLWEEPEEWTAICAAPCDLEVATGAHYRIAGGGMASSAPFFLPDQDGPNQHVSVHSANGEWFASRRSTAPAGAPKWQGTATTTLHVEGAANVNVEKERPSAWVSVCAAPCGVSLPVDGRYRITARGAPSSVGFRLQARQGEREVLDVEAGSNFERVTGIVLTVIGGSSLSFGVLALEIGATATDLLRPSPDYATFVNYSWAATGGGAVALAVGVFTIYASRTQISRRVESLPQPVAAPAISRALPAGAPPTAPAAFLPPMFAMPVMTGRF